jgi:L-lactate dehydrogenase complex protein LldE
MRVALFVTCLTDTLFPQTGIATVRVLERLGCEVVFPREQTCCGQLHANAGYPDEARPLVRRFAEVFGDPSFDAVVAPSGSCVAMVREQHARLVADDEAVAAVAARTFELSEFLVGKLGVEDVGATYPHRVTYHPTCHALRLLGVGDAPLRLLRNVRELELVALPEADSCCGFGGTFAVKNADTSEAMLADKLRCVADTGATACTALDNSCLLHIGGGLTRQDAAARAVHLAEILASEAP